MGSALPPSSTVKSMHQRIITNEIRRRNRFHFFQERRKDLAGARTLDLKLSRVTWIPTRPPGRPAAYTGCYGKRNFPQFFFRELSLENSNPRVQRNPQEDWLSGVCGHSDKHAPRKFLEAQCAFKIWMIHEVLQFALRIAFRCVLHRCVSLDIRC